MNEKIFPNHMCQKAIYNSYIMYLFFFSSISSEFLPNRNIDKIYCSFIKSTSLLFDSILI